MAEKSTSLIKLLPYLCRRRCLSIVYHESMTADNPIRPFDELRPKNWQDAYLALL